MGGAHINPGYAFEPPKNYWYIETLKVEAAALPAGIEIVPSDPATEPRGYLTLTNSNQQLVYVMSLGYKDVLVMATPDAKWQRRVNGAQEAASYLAAPNRPAHLSIESLVSLDQDLKDQNVLSSIPPPQDTPIPTPQSSELLLVYNGQVIEVPFTLTYSLNTGFTDGEQPTSVATPTGEAAQNGSLAPKTVVTEDSLFGIPPLAAGIIGAGAIVLIGVLAWRLLRRSR
jgi:hypothetical protein